MLPTDLYNISKNEIHNSYLAIKSQLDKEMKSFNKKDNKTQFLLAFSHIFRAAKDSFEIELVNLKKFNKDSSLEKNKNELKLDKITFSANYLLSATLYILEEHLQEGVGVKAVLDRASDTIISGKYLRPSELVYVENIYEDLLKGTSMILRENGDIAKGVEMIYPAILFISNSLNEKN